MLYFDSVKAQQSRLTSFSKICGNIDINTFDAVWLLYLAIIGMHQVIFFGLENEIHIKEIGIF